MTIGITRIAAGLLAMLIGGTAPALADSAAATCEVRNHGEARHGASGPCTFSQRQGNINLDLSNGDSYSLVPADSEGGYRDQKGNRVARTLTGGSTQEFKWEGGRRIILTFAGDSGYGAGAPPAGTAGAAGDAYGDDANLRPDSFDTICGVIVDGQTYRYRCGATDFYSGSQKVRTELRYPDQTIQLAWRPGSRVGLQFEGMVPQEARFSTSEGETNFVFESKTYFYYSDKGLAQREWSGFRD